MGLLQRKSVHIHVSLNVSTTSLGLDADVFALASEHQYKYHINRKWKMNKSIATPKKAAISRQIQKRAELGKASVVTRGGKKVDTKNLRRYLKTEQRRAVTLRPGANTTARDAVSLLGHSIPVGNRM